MQSKAKIFSGSSCVELSSRVSSTLNIGLSNIEISHFQDGEISVFVKEEVKNCHCIFIQSLCKPVNDNLMELMISVDALKRANAKRITLVIPYMGYSRQDRQCRTGEPISAQLVAKMISHSGASDVIVADLHALQIEGFFDIPVSNVSNFENFINDIRSIDEFNPKDFVIVAPDVGAAKKTRKFSSVLGCDMAIIDKNRSRANCSEVMNIIGNVERKHVILVDDIVDTAGTISNAAKALVEIGNAIDVRIYATHAVCSGAAFERLSSRYIEQVVFSDSIPLRQKNSDMKVVSISNVIANEIRSLIV